MKIFSKILKYGLVLSLIYCMVFGFSVQAEDVSVEEPLVVTTCGQSPGSLIVQQLAKREGIEVERKDLLKAEYLIDKLDAGEDFKTLFVTIGTSGKGLGAAGIDMKDEEERINTVIKKAKEQGMIVIGGQIEGKARRVDKADEKSMKLVAPQSDILVVHVGANEDNYYTDLAEEKDIPIYYIENTMETEDVLTELFGIE